MLLCFRTHCGTGLSQTDRNTPGKRLSTATAITVFRPFDYEKATPELMERCTPRQRRLIGDIGEWRPGSYFYSPGDQEKLISGLAEKDS